MDTPTSGRHQWSPLQKHAHYTPPPPPLPHHSVLHPSSDSKLSTMSMHSSGSRHFINLDTAHVGGQHVRLGNQGVGASIYWAAANSACASYRQAATILLQRSGSLCTYALEHHSYRTAEVPLHPSQAPANNARAIHHHWCRPFFVFGRQPAFGFMYMRDNVLRACLCWCLRYTPPMGPMTPSREKAVTPLR